MRPEARLGPPLALALALALACGPARQEAESPTSGAPAPAGEAADGEAGEDARPSVEAGEPRSSSAAGVLHPVVRAQLDARRRWRDRVLASGEATPEQRAEAHGEVGRLEHAYDRHQAAIAAYREAERLAPDDPRWPYLRGAAARELDLLDEAESALRRALELAPDDVPTLVRLGEVLLDRDRPDDAAPRFTRALELAPAVAAAHAGLARTALVRGEPGEAVRRFERALELQPAATRLRYSLGLALRDLGEEERARSELAAAGDVEVALEDPLLREVRLRSTGWREAVERGRERLAAEDSDGALEAFAAAVTADPLFALPRVELGRALLMAGRLGEAREQLERAVWLDDGPEARFNLALVAERNGDLDAAIGEYRRGLELAPERRAARRRLGMLLLAGGAPAEAVVELGRALAGGQGDGGAEESLTRVALAGARAALGRCAEARSVLEEGLARSPTDGLLAHALARVLAGCPSTEVRDGARALSLTRSLAAASPTPQHLEALAMALAETGDLAAARARLAEALERADELGRRDLLPRLRESRRALDAGEPIRSPWPERHLGFFAGG